MDLLTIVRTQFSSRELVEAYAFAKSIDHAVESIEEMVEMAFELSERDEEEMFRLLAYWKQQWERKGITLQLR